MNVGRANEVQSGQVPVEGMLEEELYGPLSAGWRDAIPLITFLYSYEWMIQCPDID